MIHSGVITSLSMGKSKYTQQLPLYMTVYDPLPFVAICRIQHRGHATGHARTFREESERKYDVTLIDVHNHWNLIAAFAYINYIYSHQFREVHNHENATVAFVFCISTTYIPT